MPARSLWFTGPRAVEIRETDVPDPGPGEVLVRTEVSAVSPGSELLAYRGDASPDLPVDESLPSLDGTFSFPFRYGYAAVGEVTAVGDGVDDAWIGETVFGFHPHASQFTAPLDAIEPVPEGCPPDSAAFLANVQTAVTLVLDGRPHLGERVAVFGQGVVGLLTTAILSRFPLDGLVTLDRYAPRRDLGERFGADAVLDPGAVDAPTAVREWFPPAEDPDRPGAADGVAAPDGAHAVDGSDVVRVPDAPDGADLAYELSGSPDALDAALDATGYGGRVVVGSWYGTRPASLTLDGRFHRSRVRIEVSQVSTIDPPLRGRWTEGRRLEAAWRWVDDLDLDALITHRIPVDRAADAYRLLDERPDEAVGVLLTY